MEKLKYSYKNSSKNDFVSNLIILVVSALLLFIAINIFSKDNSPGNKYAIIFYALSIAVAFSKIAVESIEKLMLKKFDANLITTAAILVLFASQTFKIAAISAIIYSFCKCVFDLICSDFSDKLMASDDVGLNYVVVGDENKTVSAEDLKKGDKVLVKKGEYLAFDYICQNSKRKYKSGYFTLSNEAVVEVMELHDYEIDFLRYDKKGLSKCENAVSMATLVYLIVATLFAFAMFAKSLIGGTEFFKALYTLGVYLLFVNPLAVNSGIINAVLFTRESLKDKGIYLKNTKSIEKLLNTKKIIIDESVAKTENNTLNSEVVKSVRIAEILKIKTCLLGKKDSKVNELVGFDESADEIVSDKKEYATLITDNEFDEDKKTLKIGINNKNGDYLENGSMVELVKSVKSTKWLKFFMYLRVSLGFVFNLLLMLVFASGKVSNLVNNLIVEWSIDTEQIKYKVAEKLVYNSDLTPWLIPAFQLVIIIAFLFLSMVFINKKDDKKLR